MQRNYFKHILVATLVLIGLAACDTSDNPTITPLKKVGFQSDVIKRSLGPNVVGQEIEFAFAMALPSAQGKLASAEVKASIPGAAGTYLENKSYYTEAATISELRWASPFLTRAERPVLISPQIPQRLLCATTTGFRNRRRDRKYPLNLSQQVVRAKK
jgi:hypothetical protein